MPHTSRYFQGMLDFPLAPGGPSAYLRPHAATHVPLAPWGYVTTSSVLAHRFSLVRSTVSLTPLRRRPRWARPCTTMRASGYEDLGAMTPKIARYLADHAPATPCL